jgi:uncharacterized protein (DUF952 family)
MPATERNRQENTSLRHETDEAARNAGITYHLVPEPVWETFRQRDTYVPEAYDADGFIHCTNGLDRLLEVGNMFYQNDQRSYLALALRVDRIALEVHYDDAEGAFPHIYGPLNSDAVVGQFKVMRGKDGSFTAYDAT